MNKLLTLYDRYILKIGIIASIIFIALYPKLPSIHIIRTWVYIRLEDFLILALTAVWIIQLFRKKTSINLSLTWPIFVFWSVGMVSVFYSIVFLAPQITNFFPHIAILNYLRRIEYIVLFFVAFSTIKTVKDLRDYLVVICLTAVGLVLYGYGQHYYIYLWTYFPGLFKQFPFCFPSFQTGNEEFAKGVPLCLPYGARITSTFGGHYDLAAYLVLITPIFLTIIFGIKRALGKILMAILFAASVILLIFTSSRISFAAYLAACISALFIAGKKVYVIPLVILSIALLVFFSESTAKRFLSTVRLSSIVTNDQGQLIGEALPQNLKDRISSDKMTIQAPPPAENLQGGSGFIGLPERSARVATDVAVVKKTLTPEETRRLKIAAGSIQISTVSGSFLIKKVLIYDISFTTRFQAEWPNAIKAFLRNPLLGSGYSSISLATDNDYLRFLGETGLLGLISFLFIFLIFGIAMKEVVPKINDDFARYFIFGAAGGVIGLFVNAVLIDVFEASKVAESLWIILGISMGTLMLYKNKTIPYFRYLKAIFSSNLLIFVGLVTIVSSFYLNSIANFFTADDFTWLRWAASSLQSDIPKYFTDSQNFFYRPLIKTIIFYLYTLFSFQPEGYHIFALFIHLLTGFGVYLFTFKLLNNKLNAFLCSVLFLILPASEENVYWFSTISVTLATCFIIYAINSFISFRRNNSDFNYLISLVLCVLAFLSYEIAVIIPILLFSVDVFIKKLKVNSQLFLVHLPFLTLVPIYFMVRYLTGAFTYGGDYAYNLKLLIPNMVGNFFGYAGLFLAGEGFMPIYNYLRLSLRDDLVFFIVIFIIFFVLALLAVLRFKQQIRKIYQIEEVKIILFGILFAGIALLPFLPLGNIAPRYIYLASVGFVFSFIVLMRLVVSVVFKNSKRLALILFLMIIFITVLIFYNNISRINPQWARAGQIAKSMLSVFRLDYENLTSDSNVYFVNPPIKYQNAWVFPVGITDTLWFIYRDSMPKIYQVTTIEEASRKINEERDNYIFYFGRDYNILKVE